MTAALHQQIIQNWFSPAFPIGAFSYSAGLETAIANGSVGSRQELRSWLSMALHHGAAQSDAVILARAFEGEDVNDLCLALCTGGERHLETTELGRAFTQIVNATHGLELAAGLAYPVAVGHAGAGVGLDQCQLVGAFLQSWCANQISVAVRAIPIGQLDGQQCLVALMPEIEEAARTAMATPCDEIGSFATGAELASLEHETAEQRIYRT
ncbi:MAG: urease accessory UreF family protein [Rhodobiaceae bacterium]